jgi:hypothetical protein
VEIAAPPLVVFDVIAAPYLGRTPRTMAGKLKVIERGAEMALAEHYTPFTAGGSPPATLERLENAGAGGAADSAELIANRLPGIAEHKPELAYMGTADHARARCPRSTYWAFGIHRWPHGAHDA